MNAHLKSRKDSNLTKPIEEIDKKEDLLNIINIQQKEIKKLNEIIEKLRMKLDENRKKMNSDNINNNIIDDKINSEINDIQTLSKEIQTDCKNVIWEVKVNILTVNDFDDLEIKFEKNNAETPHMFSLNGQIKNKDNINIKIMNITMQV